MSLGHKHIDTTLCYARLYDGTVAAEYYRAMTQIERRLQAPEGAPRVQPDAGYLLALVDALRSGTLDEAQRETLHALRIGIMAIARQPGAAAPPEDMISAKPAWPVV